MDYSKLPKLSESPAPPPTSTPSDGDYPRASSDTVGRTGAGSFGGNVWLSLIVGVIFIFLGQNFAHWLAAAGTGRPYATHVNWNVGPRAGLAVGYWELDGGTAWSECGMFLFGVSAVVDALLTGAMFAVRSPLARRAAVSIAVATTFLATAFNAVVVAKLFALGIFPLFSLLAVGVGGYLLFEHYASWSRLRPRQAM